MIERPHPLMRRILQTFSGFERIGIVQAERGLVLRDELGLAPGIRVHALALDPVLQ